jgi:hypothetical protein
MKGRTIPVWASDITGMGSVTGIIRGITGNVILRVW